MKNVFAVLSCVLVLSAPSIASAQGDQTSSSSVTTTSQSGKAVTTKIENAPNMRYLETLTNVQLEVTLTDQTGNQAPEKKTVTMIVANRDWGKIRSAANVMLPGESPQVVELNVDARPWLSVDGPIRLEMTLVYSPPRGPADPRDPKPRPTGINQSQTVILQSGKPLIVAQAADPVSDRKVVVEVKATILK